MDDAISYLSEDARLAAFERNWTRLQSSGTQLDLHALRSCIRLLPSVAPTVISEPHLKLKGLLLYRLGHGPQDAEFLYQLAEACSSNEQFALLLFGTITSSLSEVAERVAAAKTSGSQQTSASIAYELTQIHDNQNAPVTAITNTQVHTHNDQTVSNEQHLSQIAAFLTFLKCSYWLPPDSYHVLEPGLIELLSAFVGVEGLHEHALDTLSALLSLLSCQQPRTICVANSGSPQPWLSLDPATGRRVLCQSIIDQSLWAAFKTLTAAYYSAKSSKLFKVWFQWISQAARDGLDPEAIYEDLYWDRVRIGLLTGFADQRKYCLGIIRASLIAAKRDINTTMMRMEIDRLDVYIKAYDRYFVLYETVVLDRYANQIEACLSELSALFGSSSIVTASMAITLLSSGLDPQVQEGIRKIVGNWYFGFVSGNQSPLSKDSEALAEHTSFLVTAFLPWATQGSLFTSTLKATRMSTECGHGAALVRLIAGFIVSDHADELYRRELLESVLHFVLNTGGKMFQMSTLYLLEGLVKGFNTAAENAESTRLTLQAIEIILRISRTPGLPEIASDLYKVYCHLLCGFVDPALELDSAPGYKVLNGRVEELKKVDETLKPQVKAASTEHELSSLSEFLKTLQDTKHTSIQGPAYGRACEQLVAYLDRAEPASITSDELHATLDAMWEEADRREFNRSVAVHLPTLLFHPTCIATCLKEHGDDLEGASGGNLQALLVKAVETLQQLSEGRSYILASFVTSLRKAAFSRPLITEVLPYEDVILRFINHPPAAKAEFLFEVAAADKLQQYMAHRSYSSYYGQREWYAYAAWIDFLNRFPEDHTHLGKRIFDRLLESWAGQKGSIPVISKWKDVFQLQTMLVLTERSISEADADAYLDKFMHALTVEQWPRYRFVLEWIITRIYFRYPSKANRILKDLGHLDENSPIHIASLMKLAVLTAPFLDSEDFVLSLITQLIPFSASQKVHIRHEAHLSFPMIFELAEKKGWNSIISNPGFSILNAHIRRTEKFKTPAWSIRTLRMDAVADFTLTEIFQGQYLYIESPEPERVAHEDFVALARNDDISSLPPAHISLGDPRTQIEIPVNPKPAEFTLDEDGIKSNFFQTKSGFDFNSLLPAAGAPHLQDQQPASVILIASLIDNPTNLGGLSRISESFGLETLYINDIKKTAHKDFKATSVTSEKHLPIKELKEANVPSFLTSMKRKGYEVVGIEQTDRSGILGDATSEGSKDIGTLPRRCVLVLGAEKSGITPEVLSVIDRCVEIRTVGVTRSLNVQTAGGIAVYEWWREWAGNA